MLCCARSQWLAASVLFALAGMFRSNGVLLSGFVLWGLNIQPILDGKRVRVTCRPREICAILTSRVKLSIKNLFYSVFLTGAILVPFLYHHQVAHDAFCNVPQPASWCSHFPPSIYTHVQAKYWNVGFLRYWTLQQLPNFIISAPPVISIFYFCFFHVKHGLIPRLGFRISSKSSMDDSKKPHSHESLSSRFLSSSLTPHVIHALFLCTTLLLTSHVQIILRLGPSMPLLFWSATWLLVERPPWGRRWVAWSVIWGAISLVLWGTFLPPA